MDAETPHPSYVTIWLYLIALLIAGLLIAYVPTGKPMAVFLIVSIAVAKAYLVARHYMHLKSETVLVLAIALLPVVLLIGMALALVPDIVFNR